MHQRGRLAALVDAAVAPRNAFHVAFGATLSFLFSTWFLYEAIRARGNTLQSDLWSAGREALRAAGFVLFLAASWAIVRGLRIPGERARVIMAWLLIWLGFFATRSLTDLLATGDTASYLAAFGPLCAGVIVGLVVDNVARPNDAGPS